MKWQMATQALLTGVFDFLNAELDMCQDDFTTVSTIQNNMYQTARRLSDYDDQDFVNVWGGCVEKGNWQMMRKEKIDG